VRDDRKRGWSKAPYTGPYTIRKIQRNNNCILQNMQGKLLKKTHSISNLKYYVAKNSKQKDFKKQQFKRKKSELQIDDYQVKSPSIINIDTNEENIPVLNINTQLDDKSKITNKIELKETCV